MASVTVGNSGVSGGPAKGPIASRYSKLEQDRQEPLNRAREAARYTIPSLMPQEGNTDQLDLAQPNQGIGARGVNNLAAKLLISLLPPNAPFFRLSVDEFTKEQIELLTEQVAAEAAMVGLEPSEADPLGDLMASLAKTERTVMKHIESSTLRVAAFEVLKQLIVSGNVVLRADDKKSLKVRVYRLDSFVVRRDPSGNLHELIVRETVTPSTLDPMIREACKLAEDDTKGAKRHHCELYTHIKLMDDKWHVKQELNGVEVPNSEGTYPREKLPWFALRWTSVPGQDYGESHCWQYLGDLRTADGLQGSINEIVAAMAKLLVLVRPNSIVKPRSLARAQSGAVITGNPEDVQFLQSGKMAELQAVTAQQKDVEQRLARVFLLHDVVQRDAERVTAEEVRFMAEQLNTALGGTFSVLAQEFQMPLARLLLERLQATNAIPAIPDDLVKTAVITGLEALGRGHDLQKLDTFIAGIGQVFGPEAIATHVNLEEYMKRRAESLGLDTLGLLRDPEEIAAEQQEAQMMQMMQQLGPEAMKQMGNAQQGEPEDG